MKKTMTWNVTEPSKDKYSNGEEEPETISVFIIQEVDVIDENKQAVRDK